MSCWIRSHRWLIFFFLNTQNIKTSSKQCLRSGSVSLWASWICILPSSSTNGKKNFYLYCFVNYLWLFIFEEWCKSTGSGSSRPKSLRIHANPDTHGSETLCDTIRYPTNDLLAESGLVIMVSGCDYVQYKIKRTQKMETYLEISVPGIVVDVICDLGHAAPLGMSSQP